MDHVRVAAVKGERRESEDALHGERLQHEQFKYKR